MSDDGASPNQRLLFAARTDNEEMYKEIVLQPDTYDVNFQDGLGNTALHYAAGTGSTNVLPELLEEPVDVDLHNRLDGNTPLHEAVTKLQDEELRNWVGGYLRWWAEVKEEVEQLLEAGADPREVNKEGDKPVDLVNSRTPLGKELHDSLRKAEATAGISAADIADDDDDDEEEGSEEED